MRQQSRRDDMMRNILNMFMQKKQFEMQDRRYQDQTEQQKFQNKMAEKNLSLNERNVASNEAWRNRPEKPTEWQTRLNAVKNNPNYTPEQIQRFEATGNLDDPNRKVAEQEEIRLRIRGIYEEKKKEKERSRYKGLGWSDEDVELAMSNITPTIVLSKREQLKIDKDVKNIQRIKDDPTLTGKTKERLIAHVYGESGAWEWSERDTEKERARAVEIADISYKAARQGVAEQKPGTKEYEKRVSAYRDSGVYVELPKQYTTIATRSSKGVANPGEMKIMTTLEYFYNVIDSGGNIDDLDKEFLRKGVISGEFDEGAIRDFFRVYSEETKSGKTRKPETWRGVEIK